MNINTSEYHKYLIHTLADDLAEHHDIIQRAGDIVLTGEVALISPDDQELTDLGVLQVWSRCTDGQWVHVTPEGVVLTAADPLGDPAP